MNSRKDLNWIWLFTLPNQYTASILFIVFINFNTQIHWQKNYIFFYFCMLDDATLTGVFSGIYSDMQHTPIVTVKIISSWHILLPKK